MEGTLVLKPHAKVVNQASQDHFYTGMKAQKLINKLD